ncbi:MAG: replication factor C large subunit [Promethearchaeota archaeon]|nr:MAG: replication factor C large subunit [Candidatus Lokiarchaeota archaeon]
MVSKEDNSNNTPWVEKYRPKSLKEMAIPSAKLNRQKVNLADELKKFISTFFKKIDAINEKNSKIRTHNRNSMEKEQKEEIHLDSEDSAVLLEGKPGIGKTSIVYALANDLNMEVIETNASDTRTRVALENKLKETSKTRGIMDFITEKKKKIILIDEVDGIYGTKDRGAVPAIMDIIEETQFPIIMCANEYQSSLSSLYNKIPKYEVHPLSKKKVMKIAEHIIQKEGLTNISNEQLDLIITKNNGDLRGIINDLQAISQVHGEDAEEEKNMIYSLHRDSTEEIFVLIRDLFQEVESLKEARSLTNKSDVDYNFLYKWVNENIPTFIKHRNELATAYNRLSLADEIFGRIRKNMEWSLLPYFFDLFAGGVALARKKSNSKGFRRVYFPRYRSFYSLSLNNTEQELVEKIQDKYPISETEAMQDFVPFLRMLATTSRRKLIEISDWLDLKAREKKLLT